MIVEKGRGIMTLKKMGAVLLLIIVILIIVWLVSTYFNDSKQVYEGILVYQNGIQKLG